MIDVLNLKLCLATDVLTVRGQVRYPAEPGSIFSHSDLNLLMEFLSVLLVRKGLFRVSAINRFDFSI